MYKSEFNKALEPRLDKIEKMITRLGRRAVKQTSALITPIPISNCVIGEEVKGDVLKYLFPCPGVINKGGIFISPKPKNGATIILTIENELGGSSKSYQITKQSSLLELNMEINTWDRLTVSFYVVNPVEDKITEVWAALLWTPTVKDVTIKNYLIDNLDSSLNDED